MARRLRKWDPTKRSARSGAELNSTLTDMVATQSQDLSNKRLKKNLRRSTRAYERQAGFIQDRGIALKNQAKAIAGRGEAVQGQAKQVESSGRQYAQNVAAIQGRMQDAASRHEQDLRNLGKQFSKGDINRKQYKRYKRTARAQYAVQSGEYERQAASAKSAYESTRQSYENAVAAYKSSASRVKTQQQRYRRQAARLGRYERRYERAKGAYESGYYEI